VKCEEKVIFTTKAKARAAGRLRRMRSYRCHRCGFYHLTTQTLSERAQKQEEMSRRIAGAFAATDGRGEQAEINLTTPHPTEATA
jgi:hypothetical protein